MILALHHKCASGWAVRVFTDIIKETGITKYTAKRAEILEYEDSSSLYMVANTNYNELPKNSKGIHIYRDPRDLIVSAYFSHKNSHPLGKWGELHDHRIFLNTVNQEEGLISELKFSRMFLEDMRSWDLLDDNFYQAGMEDIFIDGLGFSYLVAAFAFILLSSNTVVSIDTGFIKRICNKNSFDNLSGGRKPGIEDKNSHYRNGKSGDWKHMFNENLRKLFKEQYGDILIQYGYEENNDW